ncbi:MAG: 40S ribosomal protein S19 [Candidatus Pacearchaeota archaeon]
MESNPVFELNAHEYNEKLAEALKQYPSLEQPEWISFVKSTPANERPIQDPDFWYKRTASILRQIYKNGSIGVNKLKTHYGDRKRRGARPETYKRGAGKIIRKILQQTDEAGLTETTQGVKGSKTKNPGRRLTHKGKQLMESIK